MPSQRVIYGPFELDQVARVVLRRGELLPVGQRGALLLGPFGLVGAAGTEGGGGVTPPAATRPSRATNHASVFVARACEGIS